jgi:hypothetical protein
VNFGLRGSIWLGSPGARCMTAKEITEMKKRVIVFCTKLRPRKANIS